MHTMNNIPVEVIRMIASCLRNCPENPDGPRGIKQFRLVDRHFSVIGAEYLLSEIHLTFQSCSFERLRTISQHPYFSQHVTHLNYEADTYQHSQLERDLIKRKRHNAEISLDEPICEAEMEAFEAYKASEIPKIHEKYKMYKRICADQRFIRQQQDEYNTRLITLAIDRLPKLKEVTLNFHSDHPYGSPYGPPKSAASLRAYDKTFFPPSGDDGHKHPYGVMQLWGLLYGVDAAGIKLKTLNIGRVDWKFLQLGEECLGLFKRVLSHLDHLRIGFYVGADYLSGVEWVLEVTSFTPFVEGYPIRDLLSSVKDLKSMSLYAQVGGEFELKYMVGTLTWTSLRVVELEGLRPAENTLIEFLTRHAGTLKELALNDITLFDGSWTSALPRMRNAVKLEGFRAVGDWVTEEPYACWPIDTRLDEYTTEDPLGSWDMATRLDAMASNIGFYPDDCAPVVGIAVKTYMLRGGDCPILSSFAHITSLD